MSTSCIFKHLDICSEVEMTGSVSHAVHILVEKVQSKNLGIISSMKEIFDCQLRNSVAVTQFLKTISPLPAKCKENKGVKKLPFIHLKFREVIYKQSKDFTSVFSAFFCGNTAVELQAAIDSQNLKPGDLVALCHPQFPKFTAAPVYIDFPSQEIINFVILRCTSFISGTKLADVVSVQSESKCGFFAYLNKSCKMESQFSFQTVNIGQVCNDKDISEKLQYLSGYGDVTTLTNILSSPEIRNDRVVLSYFLGVVAKLDCKTVIFLREVVEENHCYKFKCFFKAVLHKPLADKFQLYLNNNSPGDLVVFVNPSVLRNSNFISNELLEEEPYIVESGMPHQGILIISFIDPVFNKLQFYDSEEVSNEVKSSKLLSPVKILSFLPLNVSRPVTDSELDYVSGYCSECTQMILYSSITWNKHIPLCPSCQIMLELNFCLEFGALKRINNTREFTIILVVGRNVENYINCSVEKFILSETSRKTALDVLKRRLTFNTYNSFVNAYDFKENEITCVTNICNK